MIFFYYFLLCVCPNSIFNVYIPGTPGAPWTLDEVVTVKAKLWRLFSSGEARKLVLEGTPASPGHNTHPYEDAVGMFNTAAPKTLRQGFHDCLKYPDGSGGCDGCLSKTNMWHQWHPNDHEGEFNRPDQTGGDNNGMQAVSDILEGIYISADYPTKTPKLEVSLRDSGKSRADLWALAAMTAVEYGITTTNMRCRNETNKYNNEGCTQRDDEDDCEVVMERAFVFKTGRRDCTFEAASDDRQYWHENDEVHPNPHGSGKITMEFFKKYFNLNSREVVALMGAHTFGTMRTQNAMFRYGWTSYNMPLFNNRYYRNLINEDSWYIPTSDCQKIGDAWGNKPKTKHQIKANRDSFGGGPIQYLMFQKACPDCSHPNNANYGGAKCCDPENIPEGLHCNPECSNYRFVSGNDETFLNCDMGLYLGFDVEDDWRTVGCSGLDRWNYTMWSKRYIMPFHNNEIRHFDNKTLCFRVLENPHGSTDRDPVKVAFGPCLEKPYNLERWNYNETTGLISLSQLPGWNLCSLIKDLSEDLHLVVREHEWDGCHWHYDQFLGVIQARDHPEWCIGYNDQADNIGNHLVMKPCAGNEMVTKFGDWWYCPDHITDFECPLQELAEPAGSDPMHVVVEEFAHFQNIWVAEFMAVLEKVLQNGYEDDELVKGPVMDNIKCFLPGEIKDEEWICQVI